jgi:hypothetical protein
VAGVTDEQAKALDDTIRARINALTDAEVSDLWNRFDDGGNSPTQLRHTLMCFLKVNP